MEPEVNIETVKKRTVSGAALLTARTFLIQAISFSASILLTVFLNPVQFGVFFLVSAVINFLAYFGDIGFAASLIQKKEKLTDLDLKTIFTTQQVMIAVLILVVLMFSSLIKNIYGFGEDGVYLLWALAFSLFLSSLKTIPSVLMERKLEFNKLIIPQIAETLVFNITAVYLAWKGFGVTSFTVAVLARGVTGLILTYLIQPWLPSLAFSKSALSSMLKFGIPYQLNTLLAMVKDDGMTLFLGSILGPTGVGLLGWAQKWAFAPLRFFMDQVIKVTFPAFSRMQDNKKELSNALSKSIFYICLLVFPSLTFLIIVAPSLVEVIPKYNKWSPALLALMLLSANAAIAAVTTPITNAFNAIGKISLTFKLMIMWTTLTWLFVPALAISYGVSGAALGFVLVGLSSVVALYLAKKYVEINYLEILLKPILISGVVLGVVFAVKSLISVSVLQISLMSLFGFIVYIIATLILEPNILNYLKRKK
ncbi:hypothetical protein A3C59_00680 [Candidatus Daviesbacteria bacterium RIFCSPHIGHO2_02_FULL_36_13]|uniref:Uncharacterized protein n=1 Tax=Candidatus Daviesbacteria bacterium RIFCSPHIGHO2_02_FULL_36_13 TaxID=1797768 RepID=A0A1F5JP91_9BACT|nr:MAG: hypothetical protein A3C59_00680 [Candidatus Daviesbacteria bacterium RIFCSPHIGHO2_02_FULL_36_13]OGE41728.1 MAG: hypothetical protein A3A45_03745 [Candidatus Daviesbacteria bacterium RIFCSPLOWO2_01_FULL_36_8]